MEAGQAVGRNTVVRLIDLTGDGDALDVGEVILFADGVGNPVGVAALDSDGDGLLDNEDNCPDDVNPAQEDSDDDNVDDVCDNCPLAYNPNQRDLDTDAVEDACDNRALFNPVQAADGRGLRRCSSRCVKAGDGI